MKKTNMISIGVVIIFISWLIYSYPAFYPIPQLTSLLIYGMLFLFNINSINYNKFLIVDFGGYNRIFDISAECSGIILFSVFLFGTFIVPKFKFKHRIISLLFIPILFVGNVVRIFLSVIFARNYGVDFSIFFHNTIGQILIFGWTILIYILWLKICGNFPTEKTSIFRG